MIWMPVAIKGIQVDIRCRVKIWLPRGENICCICEKNERTLCAILKNYDEQRRLIINSPN